MISLHLTDPDASCLAAIREIIAWDLRDLPVEEQADAVLVVDELVANVCKHAPGHWLNLRVNCAGGVLHIRCMDSGLGFSPDAVPQKETYNEDGRGLKLCQELGFEQSLFHSDVGFEVSFSKQLEVGNDRSLAQAAGTEFRTIPSTECRYPGWSLAWDGRSMGSSSHS